MGKRAICHHTMILTRISKKTLDPDKLRKGIKRVIERGMGGGRRERGWICSAPSADFIYPDKVDDQNVYSCTLQIRCSPKRSRDPSRLDAEWANIVKIMGHAANAPGWTITNIDGSDALSSTGPMAKGYYEPELPRNPRRYFNHLYGVNSHVDIVLSAIRAGIESNWQDRFHVALIGEPASGKSETLRCVEEMLSKDAVLRWDCAGGTTQAGAIKSLKDRDVLPRVLILEEAEKADEGSLRWLLGAMDWRAEIRKLTYREDIQFEFRALTLLTVNDFAAFKALHSGALASRCAHKLHYPIPSRQVLLKILRREVERTNGKLSWIDPTLDYAEEMKIHDPRTLIAIMLCGKDELFNGSYQAKLRACSNHEPEEKAK
jgi:hypothetical protein